MKTDDTHAHDPPQGAGSIEAAQDQNHFIAVLAHELRNPLAPIRSGLELLATDKVSDTLRQDTIAMMRRQLAHLVRLMDDLLDTARLSRGMLAVRREATRLRDVLDAAIESIEPALRAKQQVLTVHQEARVAEAVVLADPVRLAQAFANILNSNVRQTPAGGTIAIESRAFDDHVLLTFADEGGGLDADQARDVFVLFPPEREIVPDDGLSIGLALVKGLIELNGGTVEVRNRDPVAGSIFVVSLPLSDQAADAAGAAAGPVSSDWHSHRLLIVDDNRDAAESLGLLFELDGMTIRLAHDGPSAVAEALDFQPEIILMDVGLPGFNGLEAVRRIRETQTLVQPYIVALTGWGAQADRKASRDAGVDVHLVKPVTYEQLSAALVCGAGDSALQSTASKIGRS